VPAGLAHKLHFRDESTSFRSTSGHRLPVERKSGLKHGGVAFARNHASFTGDPVRSMRICHAESFSLLAWRRDSVSIYAACLFVST
jgi:hypothetical protein